MRHLKKGRQLSRNHDERLALFRSLALALFRHERIITTLPKAKAVRPFVERLITLAKRGDLAARRLAIAKMGPAANAEVKPPHGDDEADERTIIQKLFADLGPRFKDRPGGYTRIIKRHERRLGDAGETAFLELLKAGEAKHKAKSSSAPAPAPAPEVKSDEPEQKPANPPEASAENKETPAEEKKD
jgi:large subunit ribosomal protein L17